MTNQVPVIAVMMIVNGSLVFLLGLPLAVIGLTILATLAKDEGGGLRAERLQAMTFIIPVAILLLLAGILNIFGGIRALKYRSRTLVLIGLFFNLLPIFTVYCTATSLGLLIYGLIVMFNGEVIQVFAMGDRGISADQIRAHMDRERRRRYLDDDEDEYEDYRRPEKRPRPLPPPLPPSEPGDTGIVKSD